MDIHATVAAGERQKITTTEFFRLMRELYDQSGDADGALREMQSKYEIED